MSEAEGAGVADEAAWTTEEGVTEAWTTALVLWVDGDGDEVGVTSTASTDEVVLEGEGVAEAGTTAELEEVTSTGLTDESVHVSEADAAAEAADRGVTKKSRPFGTVVTLAKTLARKLQLVFRLTSGRPSGPLRTSSCCPLPLAELPSCC